MIKFTKSFDALIFFGVGNRFIPNLYHRFPNFFGVMTNGSRTNDLFEAPDFRLTHLSLLENLLKGLTEILGADQKRMLHLVEREYEALEQDTWEGRFWNFPAYDDLNDVMLNFDLKQGLSLTIFEPINLFEDEE